MRWSEVQVMMAWQWHGHTLLQTTANDSKQHLNVNGQLLSTYLGSLKKYKYSLSPPNLLSFVGLTSSRAMGQTLVYQWDFFRLPGLQPYQLCTSTLLNVMSDGATKLRILTIKEHAAVSQKILVVAHSVYKVVSTACVLLWPKYTTWFSVTLRSGRTPTFHYQKLIFAILSSISMTDTAS